MHLFWPVFAILTTIHVHSYEECRGAFCPPTLAKPDELAYGFTLARLIGRDQKTGCYCREKSSSYIICYGRSQCTSMPKELPLPNKILKITNTHIKQFLPGDFAELGHLVDLQIEGNYNLEKIVSGTFHNLSKLASMSISFNSKLSVIEKDSFLGLINLKKLFLNNNAFENLYDLSYSLRPTVLPNILSLILDSNTFVHIGQKVFSSMQNSTLKELSLILCRIDYVHPKAFVPLKQLEKIQLGENIIEGTILTEVIKEMVETHINLNTLHLFYMGFKKHPPKSLMEVIARTNITHLNLSKNQFEVLNKDSFPYMPNLEILDIREVLTLQVSDDAFNNLPKLKMLLFAGNKLSTIPKGISVLQNLTFLDIQENSPAANYHLYFRLRNVELEQMKNLKYLNLGFNGLSHLYNTSFIGLNQLEVLSLKNSSVFHIERGTLIPMKDLRFLNLMNNLMAHGDAVPDVFFSLKHLEVLLLGGCGFKYISRKNNPFQSLGSLKHLGLEKNFLINIGPTDFQPLIAVQKIDVSFNLINSWEQRIFTDNKNLSELYLSKNKITEITVAMFDDFADRRLIELDTNAILCRCMVTYRSYKKWYLSTNNDAIANGSIFGPYVYCAYPDNLDNVTLVDFLTKPEYGERICSYRPDKIYLFLPLVGFVLFITTIACISFYYRWHIKYWIFLSKLYLSRKGKIGPKREKTGYSNYEYDAFVSYSTEDRDFVIRIVTMLENYEPYFRLCVYERDFQIGTIISESVLESVAKSRKTVLIISDNYAKSQWCRWESQICEHHRLFFENEHGEYVDDSLLLIKLSPVSDNHLTPTLKYLLKTRIYLQWDSSGEKQDTFWNRLRNTLGSPIAEITRM